MRNYKVYVSNRRTGEKFAAVIVQASNRLEAYRLDILGDIDWNKFMLQEAEFVKKSDLAAAQEEVEANQAKLEANEEAEAAEEKNDLLVQEVKTYGELTNEEKRRLVIPSYNVLEDFENFQVSYNTFGELLRVKGGAYTDDYLAELEAIKEALVSLLLDC